MKLLQYWIDGYIMLSVHSKHRYAYHKNHLLVISTIDIPKSSVQLGSLRHLTYILHVILTLFLSTCMCTNVSILLHVSIYK